MSSRGVVVTQGRMLVSKRDIKYREQMSRADRKSNQTTPKEDKEKT